MDKAPGLKIIIIIFIIFIISISIYFLWYSTIEKLTTQQLNSIQNTLLQKNIELTWDKIYKSGFPFMICNIWIMFYYIILNCFILCF